MLSVKNIIDIEELTANDVNHILESADSFNEVLARDFKKVPTLRGKTILSMFFESSTRTRNSFEIAAKRLGADTVTFSAAASSLKKGESLIDTVKTMHSMIADLAIVRHKDSGAAGFISRNIDIPLINAGDGKHQHPSQALLDLYTIKEAFGEFNGLHVGVVGDILNSRVARSNIGLFKKMGMKVSIASAPMLLPDNPDCFGVKIFNGIDEIIKNVDVLYMLRMQFERQERRYYPSVHEYNRNLSLNIKRLEMLKKEAIVMHPGPVNRGIEISGGVMDLENILSKKIKINRQVKNGVAVRMALIYLLLSK